MTLFNVSLNHFFEKSLRKAMSPLEDFVHKTTSSGIILMCSAVAAIVIANSPLFPLYDSVLHLKFTLGVGDFSITHTLHHWINDGLMVLFFFVVGLEVKREILIGELSVFRQAVLPLAGALGGMIVPACLYLIFNHKGDATNGWGIPMATDIAFALGILALLGKRVPKQLIAILLALAIVDDLGAVVVIAVFYTANIHVGGLVVVGICLFLLIATNLAGVRHPLPFFLLGVIMWLGMMKSGVHATLAGVLTALTIPARSTLNPVVFADKMVALGQEFKTHIVEDKSNGNLNILRNTNKQVILQSMENIVQKMESPLHQMEHDLHVWVSFIIIPVFAFANAGIPIDFFSLHQVLIHPVTIGVMVGLLGGKTLGIWLFSWLVVKAGISKLPTGVTFSHIGGISILAGIGFTMSIFIGSLAFSEQPEYLLNAKIGIVFASVLAGICGYVWLLKISDQQAS